VDGVWATKRERVGLIVRAISFHISNLCDHNPPTLQTDRRTDRYKVISIHRAVKTSSYKF